MMLHHIFDKMRSDHGFLTISQIALLCEKGNMIFDPLSVLISVHAEIGTGNVFYSGVTLITVLGYGLTVGNHNFFHSNTFIEATAGSVHIGSENQFGEGGCTLKANRKGARIEVGNKGRYLGGVSVSGQTQPEDGSQILGPINVDNCCLKNGRSWQEPVADERAGLLKGYGTARNLTVGRGRVINGNEAFSESMIEAQSRYHPASPL
ncbi:hypothetical protein GC090_10560 [Pantoea sp. JZ29]|uniref:hypothetical protein n=1 Tax=Pantoea sp. JZ29 TaxID=2654192 RepID=UPI002B47DFC7|nr:hypothetical protein [Pantoea sp. JZ29]WRH21084.1 hypothetical protein GC090_10560 [Pantoea sp. JZ29]